MDAVIGLIDSTAPNVERNEVELLFFFLILFYFQATSYIYHIISS